MKEFCSWLITQSESKECPPFICGHRKSVLPINDASLSGHLLAAQRNVYENTRSSETNDVHEKMTGAALRFQVE